MSNVTLYYLRPNHYCEKARAILTYKKIPFNLVNVPYGQHQAVIKASGQDYVPYIAETGQKGVTWPQIPDWAKKTKPQPTIYPGTNPVETRARSRLVEHWAHNVVEEYVWRYVVADMPKIFSDPQERWIFIELQERRRGPLEILAQRKKESIAGVEEVCSLSDDLFGQKNFLITEDPSLADFALFGALHPLKLSGNEIPGEFQKLRNWHSRMVSITS